jgi:hypothetical protein
VESQNHKDPNPRQIINRVGAKEENRDPCECYRLRKLPVLQAVLWIRIRIDLALLDPDPLGSVADQDAGSRVIFSPIDLGWKKSRFGINFPDHIYESLVRNFWFKNI